ncbi:MAG: hypothetical protein V3V96_06635 [Acidiferrobacterales bacterium]
MAYSSRRARLKARRAAKRGSPFLPRNPLAPTLREYVPHTIPNKKRPTRRWDYNKHTIVED